jgi:branched-chain amino acid transport system substrate-binding protein
MKRIKSRLLMVMVTLVVLFISCNQRKETIKIGFSSPLTGDGAVYGVPQKNAAQLAIDEYNNKGGVLNKKLILIPQDDKAEPKEAVNNANYFVSNSDIVGVIGYPNSGNAIAAAKIFSDKSMPFIASSPTNPVLTELGYHNIFRFAPTDDFQASSSSEFILNKLKINKIAVIHDNEAYGKGIAEGLRKNFTELGGEVGFFDAIQAGNQDFKSILIKVSKSKLNTIFYGGMLREGALLIKQAKELGLKIDFIFGDGCFDNHLEELAGTDCKNVFISFLAPPWEELESSRNFVESYHRTFNIGVAPFAPYGYDAVKVLVEAIKAANSTEKDKILKVLKSSDFKLNGITGEITFDEKGQNHNQRFYFYTFNEDGKLVLYK